MILPNSVFTRSDRLRPNTKIDRLSGTEFDKSFVDDFAKTGNCTCERFLVFRSTEVQPMFYDLYKICGSLLISLPPKQKHPQFPIPWKLIKNPTKYTLHFYIPLSGLYTQSIFQVKHCKNVENFKMPYKRGVENSDLSIFGYISEPLINMHGMKHYLIDMK